MNKEQRLRAMLAYLPCKAGEIPLNLRNLRDAEQDGLARMDDSYRWQLTEKGKAFVGGTLKAPKANRFA